LIYPKKSTFKNWFSLKQSFSDYSPESWSIISIVVTPPPPLSVSVGAGVLEEHPDTTAKEPTTNIKKNVFKTLILVQIDSTIDVRDKIKILNQVLPPVRIFN